MLLEPLRPGHVAALLPALEQPEIWSWLPVRPRTRQDLDELVLAAGEAERAVAAFAFAVIERESGRPLGSTRYLEVDARNRSVEIGWTWYLRECWGTHVNPETKLLLLRHAFEDWLANRVFLKTDTLNVRSRAAIERLGAVPEGVLRNHRVRPDGSLRHSAFYSILPEEWPAVRTRLEERLR